MLTPALVLALVLVACGDEEPSAQGETQRTAAPTASSGATSDAAPTPANGTPDTTAAPEAAADPASRITAVERAIRDPNTLADELASLGWEQQSIYRDLSADQQLLADVLASVPDDIAVLVYSNVGASQSLTELVEPPDSLPDFWRIVEPAPAQELLGYYREAEQASGIPWQYLAAINLVETRMGRIVGDSTAGAQGPMQFIPSSWEAFGEGGDVRDPHDAILAAGRYLAAAGGPADMEAALYAYNHSDAYVDAIERYAAVMEADERAYLGYHGWQVIFATVDGPHRLPAGYPEEPAVPL